MLIYDKRLILSFLKHILIATLLMSVFFFLSRRLWLGKETRGNINQSLPFYQCLNCGPERQSKFSKQPTFIVPGIVPTHSFILSSIQTIQTNST